MMSSKGRFDQFHKNKHEDGAAMIVVVCVLMVVMLLCLTLIVGAYQTMSTVNDGRCYQLPAGEVFFRCAEKEDRIYG